MKPFAHWYRLRFGRLPWWWRRYVAPLNDRLRVLRHRFTLPRVLVHFISPTGDVTLPMGMFRSWTFGATLGRRRVRLAPLAAVSLPGPLVRVEILADRVHFVSLECAGFGGLSLVPGDVLEVIGTVHPWP